MSILLGKITRPHGLRGRFHVHLSFRGEIPIGIPLSLVHPEAGERVVHLVRLSQKPGKRFHFLLETAEITSIEEAQRWAGAELFVEPEHLPLLPEGEYYDHELVGLPVHTVTGAVVGHLEEILSGPGQDLLVVTGGGREHLVPFVPEIVKVIDPEGEGIVIDPPEGLLDL
ncbi:MAG: 16S rRNA processing protein RimM [Deltaproteobacteria bacterium]|nr:MAG: 16S rRNA processing protein RimM [Deltaproteobacteria bacterium]